MGEIDHCLVKLRCLHIPDTGGHQEQLKISAVIKGSSLTASNNE